MGVQARIELRKPDLEDLRRSGMTAIDMHYHSRYSDTYTRVSKIVAKAEKLSLGVAITDHNEIAGSIVASKLREDILVIPGIETHAKEGPHLLSYFPRNTDLKGYYDACVRDQLGNDPFLRTSSSVREIIDWTHEFGGIVSAAHPFCPGMMGLCKAVSRGYVDSDVLGDLDAVEVMTGVNMKRMTNRSIRWASELDMPITAGSDGHSLIELGNIVTYAQAATPAVFIKEILGKRSFVVGRETSLLKRAPSYTMTTKKHLDYLRPFIATKARNVMNESVYYYTQRLKAAAVRKAIAVNRRANGIPGRLARKGLSLVPLIKNGKKRG